MRELGDKRGMANSLHSLGLVVHAQGDVVTARALFQESLMLFNEVGNKRGIIHSLVGWAKMAQVGGQLERATKLCGAVKALLDAINARLDSPEREIYERTVSIVRSQLSATKFAANW